MTRYRLYFLRLALILALCLTIARGSGATTPDKEVYPKLKTFTEALSLIDKNYVEDPNNEDLVDGAIRGMLTSLDPHSAYMTKEQFAEMQVDTRGEFGGLGIQIGVKDGVLTVIAPIEDTPAEKAGILAGDQIVKIGGKPAKDYSLQDAVKSLRGLKGTAVTITVYRESTKAYLDFTIIRDIITVKSVKQHLIDDTVGYVRISQFQERTAEDLSKALETIKKSGASSLVIDLRNNPGGLLNSAIDVADQILPRDTLVVYTLNRQGQRTEFRTPGQLSSVDWPLVLLVNSGSASASEIVAGAVKDWKRGIVLGTRSFGKGSVQTVIPLSDGSGLRLTTSKYYTPKGISIQGTGIEPEVKVELPATEGQTAHKIVRERDLEGHLLNDQVDEGDALPTEEVMPFQIDEKNDLQLQKAVEILRPHKASSTPAKPG